MLSWLDRETEKSEYRSANIQYKYSCELELGMSSRCTIVQLHFGIVKDIRSVQFQRLKLTVLSPELCAGVLVASYYALYITTLSFAELSLKGLQRSLANLRNL